MPAMKEIPGKPGYFASEDGFIYSKKLVGLHKLQSTPAHNGELRVRITTKGVAKRMYVPQLIAMTYLDKPENTDILVHVDGDKNNNSVANLKWTSSTIEIPRVGEPYNGWSMEVLLTDLETGKTEVFSSLRLCAARVGCSLSSIRYALYHKSVCVGRYTIDPTWYEVRKNNNGVELERRKIDQL